MGIGLTDSRGPGPPPSVPRAVTKAKNKAELPSLLSEAWLFKHRIYSTKQPLTALAQHLPEALRQGPLTRTGRHHCISRDVLVTLAYSLNPPNLPSPSLPSHALAGGLPRARHRARRWGSKGA